jgi:hypothetical protein
MAHTILELEILKRRNEYVANATLRRYGGVGDARLANERPFILDQEGLNKARASADWDKYGELLSKGLFADEYLRRGLYKAIAQKAHLLRLYIADELQELQLLYWETLRDPERPNVVLGQNESLPLVRGLWSDAIEGRERPRRSHVRALVEESLAQAKHTVREQFAEPPDELLQLLLRAYARLHCWAQAEDVAAGIQDDELLDQMWDELLSCMVV